MPRPDLSHATPAELQLELLGRSVARTDAEIARLELIVEGLYARQIRRRMEIGRLRPRAIAERVARDVSVTSSASVPSVARP